MQPQRRVAFAVQFQLTAHHENKFLAVMPVKFARLLERMGLDLADDGRKLLIRQVHAEIA